MQSLLEQRFFRYLSVSSQSDAAQKTVPSSQGQLEFATLLATELEEYNMQEVHIDEHAIVTAMRPGNKPNAAKIGFVAHLDTVNVGLSPAIKPQVLQFHGEDLCLNAKDDIWLRVAEHPEILPYKDEKIIFSNGNSVLGADNKAAVAVIMELLAQLDAKPFDCGDIYVAFVPDEEIGLRGAKLLDFDRFRADFAYTIDCCALGEIVLETFNAASVSINIKGIPAHPMSAKNVLVNPIRVAHDLIGCFDRLDTPEHTEQREGYFHFANMSANPNGASITMNIRDFDKASYEARKNYVHEAVKLIQARYAKAEITCTVTDVYSNIKDSLGEDKTAINLMLSAFRQLGIDPNIKPMRGGTDGSALSARGLFTPNYFTGALNFHSNFEFLPLSSFEKSYQVTEAICKLVGEDG